MYVYDGDRGSLGLYSLVVYLHVITYNFLLC